MKKIMKTLAAVLCCAMISTLFTACGSDEEKKTDDNTPVACGMSYMISIGRDLFDHANFTVEYYDANGKLQSEKMANELWEKEITTKLPGIVGVQVKMQMKDGVSTADIDLFSIDYLFRYEAYILTADGKKTTCNLNAARPSIQIHGSDVPNWVEEHSVLKAASFCYTFDANGKYSNTGF